MRKPGPRGNTWKIQVHRDGKWWSQDSNLHPQPFTFFPAGPPPSAAAQTGGLMEKVVKSLCSNMVFSSSVSPLSSAKANSRTLISKAFGFSWSFGSPPSRTRNCHRTCLRTSPAWAGGWPSQSPPLTGYPRESPASDSERDPKEADGQVLNLKHRVAQAGSSSL